MRESKRISQSHFLRVIASLTVLVLTFTGCSSRDSSGSTNNTSADKASPQATSATPSAFPASRAVRSVPMVGLDGGIVVVPNDWETVPDRYISRFNHQGAFGRLDISTQQSGSHQLALDALASIPPQYRDGLANGHFTAIASWPAYETHFVGTDAAPGGSAGNRYLFYVAAIAADPWFIRITARLDPQAPQSLLDDVVAIAMSIQLPSRGNSKQVAGELDKLRASVSLGASSRRLVSMMGVFRRPEKST